MIRMIDNRKMFTPSVWVIPVSWSGNLSSSCTFVRETRCCPGRRLHCCWCWSWSRSPLQKTLTMPCNNNGKVTIVIHTSINASKVLYGYHFLFQMSFQLKNGKVCTSLRENWGPCLMEERIYWLVKPKCKISDSFSYEPKPIFIEQHEFEIALALVWLRLKRISL